MQKAMTTDSEQFSNFFLIHFEHFTRFDPIFLRCFYLLSAKIAIYDVNWVSCMLAVVLYGLIQT